MKILCLACRQIFRSPCRRNPTTIICPYCSTRLRDVMSDRMPYYVATKEKLRI